MKLTWFWEAFLAMILLVPAWLGLAGFSRVWNIRGEVALLWYMLGVIIGVAFFTAKSSSIIPENSVAIWWLIGLGIFVGAVANILVFRAVAHAPNAGLPIAITGSASVFVFLSTIFLAHFFPKFFVVQNFDWLRFGGIVLTMIGIGLISIRQ
ncbi:MAG: hypothetical protein AAB408_03710 [Patescibacteria group bacterium]